MYHEVYRPEEYERFRELTNPAYNTELSVFRRQMAGIHENNINTLTIDEILSSKSKHKKNAVCLTFDDGWLGNYLHAYPVLQEFGFRATFFVATSLIGNQLYMNWEQLKQMQASGMSIQSHTVSHLPMGNLENEELIFELSESKKIIEEKLSTSVKHLSLPHGHKGKNIWSLAKKIGYQSVLTSEVGFYSYNSLDPWIKRISIGDSVSENRFLLIVQGKYRAICDIIIIKSLKNAFKRVVGVNNYRKLYRRMYRIKG